MSFLERFWYSLVVGVAVAFCGSEVTTRTNQLSRWILRRAARRLPTSVRADQLEEWLGNLADVVEAPTQGLPVTRLLRGLAYAVPAWWRVRQLANATDPRIPAGRLAAYHQWVGRFALRIAERLTDRGWPDYWVEAAALLPWCARILPIFLPVDIGLSLLFTGSPICIGLGTAASAFFVVQQALSQSAAVTARQTLARQGVDARVICALLETWNVFMLWISIFATYIAMARPIVFGAHTAETWLVILLVIIHYKLLRIRLGRGKSEAEARAAFVVGFTEVVKANGRARA